MSDPHAQTALLYDGELDRDGELAARAHLATCEACQRELEDLMGMDAAIGRASEKPDTGTGTGTGTDTDTGTGTGTDTDTDTDTGTGSRRWLGVVALAVVAAAAILIIVVNRPARRGDAPPSLALAPTRALEVRFSAAPFVAHRAYAVSRGADAAEPIALATLAQLERAGDRATLVAAASSAGDRGRAIAAARALPDDAAGRADRAALALLDRDPARALTALGSPADDTAIGAWNRALALRDLDLPLAAEAAFTAIGARGEPGWSDEAGARADALVAAIERRGAAFAELQARGRAMALGTGPALTAEDARRSPAYARVYLLDALRTGVDRATLAPIADVLDALAGDGSARAAIDRAAARDPAVRARFAPRYRALIDGSLAAADAERLVAELVAAGAAVDDLAIGALVATRGVAARLDVFAGLVERNGDAWYPPIVIQERARLRMTALDPRGAAAILAPALAQCGPALALRCGDLAIDLAQAQGDLGLAADAEANAAAARRWYAAAGAPAHELRALGFHADTARYRGEAALARALYGELILRAADPTRCLERGYAQIGLADLALVGGDLAGARAALPDAAACPGSINLSAIVTAVDLARQTDRDDDRARAAAWLAKPDDGVDPRLPLVAVIGAARLAIERDVAAGEAALTQAIATARPDEDPTIVGWAWAALVSARAAAGDWPGVIELGARELRRAAPERCAVIVSADDDRVTVAIRGADGRTTGSLRRVPRAALATTALVDDNGRARLAGCDAIPVFARAPFHGRPDLLPAALPWSFASAAPATRAPATAAAPRVVIVADPVIAPGLALPRLAPPRPIPGAIAIGGADATPRRVLAELIDATYVELHVHGVADLATRDASYLALSPGPDGGSTLTAGDLRTATLRGAPIVVLAACRASAQVAHLHARWSLPEAFRAAGARAVIAADVDLPDAEATALFDRFRAELARGATPAAALATARVAFATTSWAAHVMLFE